MKYFNLLIESIEYGIHLFVLGSVLHFWVLYLGGVI